MTTKFKIFGYGDDLIEIRGINHDFSDEIMGEDVTLVFDDGSILRVRYGPDSSGCWRIDVIQECEAVIKVIQIGNENGVAVDCDGENYSDVVTIEHSDSDFGYVVDDGMP